MARRLFLFLRRCFLPFDLCLPVLLTLQILLSHSKYSFAYVSHSVLAQSKPFDRLPDGVGDPRRHSQRRSIYAELAAAVTTVSEAETTRPELYDTATRLLELLLEQRNEDIEPPFEAWLRRNTASCERRQTERSEMIDALIEQLTRPALGESTQRTSPKNFLDRLRPPSKAPPCYYDPSESLFGGGFYCTLYFYYPNTAASSGGDGKPPEDPIWEKTSLKDSNIKGQQYYIRNDFQHSVINYSEIWGPAVTISAEGVLTPIDDDVEGNTKRTITAASGSPGKTKEDSRTLRRLPDVFRVDATKISASIFGLSLDFNIQGSANLVVLYADPRLRIFVSPLPSETLVGNWEEAGLVVVQVRGDLVPATNEGVPRIVDLR